MNWKASVRKINQAREKLITILAHIEAHIDFPEEDIAPETRESLLRDTQTVLSFVRSLIATAREGKILREGISWRSSDAPTLQVRLMTP